jgi:hypothetical protein
MAILSGQRGDKSKKENKARSSRTEKRIRGAGLPGPTKVSGRYTENPGTPDEKKVGEKSHVVSSGKMGKRRFKKTIEKLGTERGLKQKHPKTVHRGSHDSLFCCIITSVKQNHLTTLCPAKIP